MKVIKLNYIVLSIIIILIAILIISPLLWSKSHMIWGETATKSEESYIKWVDFTPTAEVLSKTAKLDIESHQNNNEVPLNWIELISYLACLYGGDFDKFKTKDLTTLTEQLKSGITIQELTQNKKNYDYYFEAYDAVLHEFIGSYQLEITNNDSSTNSTPQLPYAYFEKNYEEKYGIKAFLPIASGYSFEHYDDFGNARSYGYKRRHLGNDLMGSIGTPIIAVESGTIEALGWNQYGGWRIGIRSFDKKRYYYYAHLRKNHPYAPNLKEGDTVNAGDVIGYLGMTGYSTKENVNNINIPHLHFGLQLIFDESQKEGTNQIWIDVYEIIEFLKKNTSEVYKENKDYFRKYHTYETES